MKIFAARYPEPAGKVSSYVVNSDELAKAREEAKQRGHSSKLEDTDNERSQISTSGF